MIAEFRVADTVWVEGDKDAAAMVMVRVAVAVPGDVPAPVPVIVTVLADCDVVGVPETTPVEVSRLRPAGSVPDVTENVTGVVSPEAVNAVVAEMAVFTVAEMLCDDGERDAAVVTVNEMVAVAVKGVPAVESVPVIVTTAADWTVVGVPDTTPVEALRDKPAGNAPDVTA